MLDDAALTAGLAALVAVAGARYPRLASAWVPALALAVLAVTALVLAAVTYPATDDYVYAVAGRDQGLAFQSEHWRTWSGRFLATALLSFWPGLIPFPGGYPLMVMLAAAVTASGLATLAWRLLPAAWPAEHRLSVVAWGGLGLIAGWPSYAEGVSWLAGALTYTLPLGLAAWSLVGLLGRAIHPALRLVAVVLAGLACGGSELVLVGVLSVIGGGSAWMWWRRDARRWWWTAALVLVLLAALVSLGAPGNRIRQQVVLEGRVTPGLALACGQALGSGWYFCLEALLALAPAACLANLMLAASRGAAGGAWRCPSWLALGLPVTAPLVGAALSFPSIFATGMGVPPRGANVIWSGVWACLAASGVVAGIWWAGSAAGPWRRRLAALGDRLRRRFGPLTVLAIGGALAAGGLVAGGFLEAGFALVAVALVLAAVGVGRACRSLDGPACATWLGSRGGALVAALALAACLLHSTITGMLTDLALVAGHARAIDRQRRLLAESETEADVQVPIWDPQWTPRRVMAYGLTGDPGDWANRAAAAWHGVRTVRVVPP